MVTELLLLLASHFAAAWFGAWLYARGRSSQGVSLIPPRKETEPTPRKPIPRPEVRP